MERTSATSGIEGLDRLLSGLMTGDNVVLEVDSGAPVEGFLEAYVAAAAASGSPLVYVSLNRSPQTITERYGRLGGVGANFTLVDCFSSGKGKSDETFLEFYRSNRAILVESPSDPSSLEKVIAEVRAPEDQVVHYVFDSMTGMFDLWSDEETVLRFFGHLCPRLYDLNTVAYWLLEKDAHTEQFLAKVRHITQVVLDIGVSHGVRTVTARKVANRNCLFIGLPQRFEVSGDRVTLAAESRENRELTLLTRMSEALDSALNPASFFEQTMEILAAELGMVRGTLVLLDRATNKLRIAAAHGLGAKERIRGEYAIGEGITGRVVETGQAEVVPDISMDPRFLDRTAARRGDLSGQIAFICVPLRVDGEVVGALSVDRPYAVSATLEKDRRLLCIVASTVAQVLKINRIMRVEKEEILQRDDRLMEELKGRYRIESVVGKSGAIRRVLAAAATAARSRASILVSGETGTGKELMAHIVHYNSDRAGGPFVRVNCGALPETLLESELFGHVRGAFTGAVKDRKGRFEMAGGGTIFLDEIAEMSPRLQVKLLRVLQEGEFEPVGSSRTMRADVRVVAATNRDLKHEIAQGRFREDLYYRIGVIPIKIPPLRERREDIPLLTDRFLEKYNDENGRRVTKLSRKVLDLLVAYDWPGNVRELENCIERAVVMSPGDTLTVEVLPEEVVCRARTPQRVVGISLTARDALREMIDARWETEGRPDLLRGELLHGVEEALIRKGIESGMSQRSLAKGLGLSRATLRKRMDECGL